MHRVVFIVLVAVLAVVLAEGQYYVPRSYYTIDAEGHVSAPVPLRRLRRSLNPYPYPYSGANANANANAEAISNGGGSASANANAKANAHSGYLTAAGNWALPSDMGYGSSNPSLLSAGQSRRLAGPIVASRSVTASSSIGLDSTGKGYYDTYTSVDK